MNALKFGFLFLALGLVLFSCQKDKTENTAISEQKEAINEAFVSQTFDEVQDIADEAYYLGSHNLKAGTEDFLRFSDCVTITLDTTVMPRILTIDFGEENCLCRDGKYRRGKIIVSFNGRYRQPGTLITHSFDNYFVNDNQVEGTHSVENMGFNEDQHMWFAIEVQGQLTLTDSTVHNWNATRNRTWIRGFNTPIWRDDAFLITGNGNYSNSTGSNISRTIITPLLRELSCPFFVSGTVEIVPSTGSLRLLDFGDGSCDNLATLTIGERVITIVLR
ncbi:MAG: hypothetical protein KJ578_03720 [Bacteroidetes bacterium]|nr:hypothetical protein [Bacteroidota bacterium]MBU1578736.1 hypothetical protein [Bacteroidota bacterium]MBU2466803.1 hypothetical protein [Bacteroidota bacterium]MBU2556869.1 hypothetical protein [Bacteroidota bacterium]